jgi:hypothetical protein
MQSMAFEHLTLARFVFLLCLLFLEERALVCFDVSDIRLIFR